MSVLARILARVHDRIELRKRQEPLERLRERAERVPAPPSLRAALERPGIALIAEAKQRSPSRPGGFVPAARYDPAALARAYESAGARAISVLTEPDFFGGSEEHLRSARAACRIPVLRKDFLVDPYQCWEAKAWGASGALLVATALEDGCLAELHALLLEIGLDPLVEVHTEAEAERAFRLPARLVGVNNRDLRTFATDRSTTARIARLAPPGTTIVSESGIFTREHVLEVERAGAAAVLVGEALLVAEDPGAKARELIGTAPGGRA